MAKRKRKVGYCSHCVANVPFVRYIRSRPLRILDTLSLGIARLFRVGPWYCAQCDKKVIVRQIVRSKAPTYRKNHEVDDHPNSGNWRKVQQPVESKTAESFEPAGNYIRTNESLVVRSNRLKRFSEKYRDAVVNRILSGATSLAQVKSETKLNEAEVLDWINDKLQRLEAENARLRKLLVTPCTAMTESPETNHSMAISPPDLVEGEVRAEQPGFAPVRPK